MKNHNINHPIPASYTPYEAISFCGNTFKNLKYIIDDNGLIPILIGKGDFPRIWLYAKNNDNPIALVKDSISVIPQIKVAILQKNKTLKVEILNSQNSYISILEIDFGDNKVSVNKLDLRPVGYNMFGDTNSLNIGGNQYSQNIFEGMQTLVKIENNNR